MDNKIWGPYFWFTLHTVTLAYPENPNYITRRHYNDFFLTLQNVLPCNLCREHYKKHLQEYPISAHLDSKESIVKWCFNLHNKVNQSLGKPNFGYEEFREKYRKIFAPTILERVINENNIQKYRKYKCGAILILIFILLGIIYKFYKKRQGMLFFKQ